MLIEITAAAQVVSFFVIVDSCEKNFKMFAPFPIL